MSGLRFDHGASTHTGRVRAHNEDAFVALPERGVFVVADGMGGHERGEWASAALVDRVRATPLPDGFDAACRVLADALHAANRAIWEEGRALGHQIGCTAVALLLRDDRFAVLWVGDSRAYLVRGGQVVRLTHDHTQVQALVDRGLLAPADAHNHPLGHVLARAVGVGPAMEVDVVHDRVAAEDVFLLCSDGLTGSVADGELGELLAGGDQQRSADRLVELTLARGAPDNVTVVAVGARQPTLLHLGAAATGPR